MDVNSFSTGPTKSVPVGQHNKQGHTRLQNDMVDAKRLSLGPGVSASAARNSLKNKLPSRPRSRVFSDLLQPPAQNFIQETQGQARPQFTPMELNSLPTGEMLPEIDPATSIKLEELLSSIPLQQKHTRNQLTEYFTRKNQRAEEQRKVLARNLLGRLLQD